MTFDELCSLLEALGFEASQDGTSHRKFHKEGVSELLNLQRDKNGKAKPYQVKQVRELLNKYKLDL